MRVGAPIDASIRRMVIKGKSEGFSLPDSSGNLDPAPQLLMSPGSEQYAFQYPDGLGDGRDQYEGYDDAGAGASDGASLTDSISAHIERPKNKTYTLSYNVPFPIQILGTSHTFGVGSGTVTFQSGTINVGGNLNVIVSGVSGNAADLKLQITVKINQVL